MVRKVFVALLVAIVSMVGMLPDTASAADPANYDAEYSATNFYTTSNTLRYYFSGLDPATEYTWNLQKVLHDGSLGFVMATKRFTGGTFVTVDFEDLKGDFGLDLAGGYARYQGPARVVDNWQQVKGRHYMLYGCSSSLQIDCPNYDWQFTGAAVNPETDRHVIGSSYLSGLNDDGYFHDVDRPSASIVQVGNFTFLHYRATTPGTDVYRILKKDSTTVLYEFKIADLVTYNTDIRNSVLTPTFVEQSFVVLNTDGSYRPFISIEQDRAAFSQAASGDNPHRAVFEAGAYDYKRTSSIGVNISDGESTMLVSKNLNDEWKLISAANLVPANGTLRLEIISNTQEIWDSGYLDTTLTDSVLGVIDTDDYLWRKSRTTAYTVDGIEQVATATLRIDPVSSNLAFASLADRRYEVSIDYAILNAFTPESRTENTLAGFGMDTDLGKGIGMVLAILIGLFTVAYFGGKSFTAFGVAYIAIGGVWLVLGMGNVLLTIVFAATVLVILFAIFSGKSPTNATGDV